MNTFKCLSQRSIEEKLRIAEERCHHYKQQQSACPLLGKTLLLILNYLVHNIYLNIKHKQV